MSVLRRQSRAVFSFERPCTKQAVYLVLIVVSVHITVCIIRIHCEALHFHFLAGDLICRPWCSWCHQWHVEGLKARRGSGNGLVLWETHCCCFWVRCIRILSQT